MKHKVFISLLVIFLLSTAFGSQAGDAAAEPVHPRLYFDQEHLASLRALQGEPSHQAIWNSIKSWADAHIGDSPPNEPSSAGGVWWNTAYAVTQYIETMAFMYAMTDDTAYADAAKDWMLSIMSWSTWDYSWEGLVASIMATGAAFGYDVLYNYFTTEQRTTVLNGIVSHVNDNIYTPHSAEPIYDPYYPNNEAYNASGVGLAALALGDDYSGASDWLDFAVYQAQWILGQGGQDGGWVEGMEYASSLDYLVAFLDALKRVKGQDLFENAFLKELPYYWLYCSYNGNYLLFEDCGWWNVKVSCPYRLASEYNDGYAQWCGDDSRNKSSIQTFIWKDPTVVATPPSDLPLTRHFRDLGYVIFRTGWGTNDLLFAFKSGTSRGHAHPSQNEFGIYYQGTPITCGPGYVCMTDLDDTWSQNCLLVDGKGQGQEPGDYQSLPLGTTGVIEQVDVHDPYYRYVLGDASAVYTGWSGTVHGRTYQVGKLDKWLRHIVFIEPSYFVMYDEVTASEAKQFDWLLQAPKVGNDTGNIAVTGNTITLVRDGVKLVIDVLEPASFSYSTIPYNNPYGSSSYIKLHPTEDTSDVRFLTAHFPLAEDGSALPTEKVSVGNVIGAKVIDGDNLDLILFSADGNPVDEYIELGDYFEAIDGGDYLFESTGVRVQFDSYQVLRLQKSTNHPPALNPIGDKSVNEGELLTFTISATDPDGDPLTYSTSNLPEGASFDPESQTFSWTPDQAGVYPNIHFEVSDGELTDSEDITITVETSGTTNHPPVLNPIGDKSVVEGEPLEFTISATDPDGDNLSYSASNLPQGASFAPEIEHFLWTPDQAGVYSDIHFEVSDGELTDSEDITISVNTALPPAGGGGGGGFGGGGPPTISNISLDEITKTTADIRWTTHEPSTSQVEYWASPSKLSPLNGRMAITHKVHLTDLTGGTTYHFRVMSMDRAGNLAVSDEHSFTTLGVPAAFSVSAVDITPVEVDIGEEVTISVLVTNSGDATGAFKVILQIDDVVVATKDVEDLAGGASQKVTFTTFKDAAGTVVVDVNGITGSFVVREAATTEINVGGESYPTTIEEEPEELMVTAPSATPAFSWVTLGQIIGVALILIGVTVSTVLLRRRRLLRRLGQR